MLSRRHFIKASVSVVLSEPFMPRGGQMVLRRKFKCGKHETVPLLGFGTVHLPQRGEKPTPDYLECERLIDLALEHGVNFFDTGYRYYAGEAERVLGRALRRHPRGSYILQDKMPIKIVRSLGHARKIFEEQLKRCSVDYFDNYLIHNIATRETYDFVCKKLGVLEYLREEKRKGRIINIGFSFHGDVDLLKYILEDSQWDLAVILMNAVDWHGVNNSRDLYALLCKHHIPVFVMEPLCGGRLANLPPHMSKRFRGARPGASDASWAFRWCASFENVVCIMSGPSCRAHLTENIGTFSDSHVSLTEHEKALYEQVVVCDQEQGAGIPCGNCKYCLPCPCGVDIPRLFAWWNWHLRWVGQPNDGMTLKDKQRRYRFLKSYFDTKTNADRCIGCGFCEKKCPQLQFSIPDEIMKIQHFVDRQRGLMPEFIHAPNGLVWRAVEKFSPLPRVLVPFRYE